MSAKTDLLIVGHIVADWHAGTRILGGTAAYAAHVARAFGANIRLLTSAAAAEPLLKELDFVEIRCLTASQTTTMENIYDDGERQQLMRQVAAPIGPQDIPPDWRDARYVLLACMAGEIDPSVAQAFPQATTLLTAQGYFRAWDEDGRVRPKRWFDEKLLRAVDVTVFSEEDIRDLTGQLSQFMDCSRQLVITRGRKGGTLYSDGQPIPYETLHLGEHELTGAGDVFAASLLCGLRAGLSVVSATRLAGRLAGISVTREGMDSAPTKEEIAEQMARLRVEGGGG